MTLVILIVFAIPAVAFLGQIVGAVVGFVGVLIFQGIRGLLRHFVVGGVRKLVAKAGTQ